MLLCARSSTRVSRNEKNRYLTLVTLDKMGLWAKFVFIVLPQWQILKETGVFQSTIAFTTTITRPRIEKTFRCFGRTLCRETQFFQMGATRI